MLLLRQQILLQLLYFCRAHSLLLIMMPHVRVLTYKWNPVLLIIWLAHGLPSILYLSYYHVYSTVAVSVPLLGAISIAFQFLM